MNNQKDKSGQDTDWQKFYPLCPYCGQEINKMNVYVIPLSKDVGFPMRVPGGFKRDRSVVTSCPHCRKVLGVYDYITG
jgi:hypothetical protein